MEHKKYENMSDSWILQFVVSYGSAFLADAPTGKNLLCLQLRADEAKGQNNPKQWKMTV